MNEESSLKKPYIRISRKLHSDLAALAQKEGTIPASSASRRSLVNLGIEILLERFVEREKEKNAQ